ncbi:MAG: 50S ribosomal protein L31e [Candidatus Bathyarchaeota archaeon]|nr:50S ribosomal protein L31e [Candidatus Bathyarchaeota archaeon]MDH5747585.1 50S ribosomal protein L31e [Candidatus Bathyarchaeota archaeon]
MMEEESEEEEQKTEEGEQAEPTEEAAEETETAETLEKEEEAIEEKVEVEEELPPAEEEVKPPPRKEIEEEIVEERTYTIPLGKAWITPPNKRAPKAMRIIKDFVKRHMKLEARREGEEEEEPKRLIVSNDVNERVWRRGIEKPPRKIRVRAAKDKDGNVTVYLAEGD